MKLNWKKNETSGNMEATFAAKLEAVSDRTFKNVNDTEYRIATIKLPESGESKNAIMYESNYQHGVEVGKTYACRIIFNEENPDNVLLTVSHLIAGGRATLSDFGINIEDVKETADDFDKVREKVKEEVA